MTVNCDFVDAFVKSSMRAVDRELYIYANRPSGVSLLLHHSIILYNVHADVTVNYLRFRDIQLRGAHMTAPCARGMVNNAYISIVLASGTLECRMYGRTEEEEEGGCRHPVANTFGNEKLYIQKLHTISIINKEEKKNRKNVD